MDKINKLLNKLTDQTTMLRDVFAKETVYTVWNDWTEGKTFKGKTLYTALSKMVRWLERKNDG